MNFLPCVHSEQTLLPVQVGLGVRGVGVGGVGTASIFHGTASIDFHLNTSLQPHSRRTEQASHFSNLGEFKLGSETWSGSGAAGAWKKHAV